MELYHRLGSATTYQEADELLAEMKDRFGIPPLPVLWLYHMTRIRAFTSTNRFTYVKITPNGLLAERQKGKSVDKKNIPLTKKFTNPKDLELAIIELLKKYFDCKDPT
jgi:transcription-repair coupling factor (superfamily II helicase)